MKKSEYTVTMPILDYEQFCEYKKKYEQLVKDLRDCYDTKTHDKFPNEPIRLDVDKTNIVCKKLLGMSYEDVSIVT